MSNDLLVTTQLGLFCPIGDFYIDPWQAVNRAIITHAHADHATPGSNHYLTARPGQMVLETRLGNDAPVSVVDYGETVQYNSVHITLHPAGHVLGSAQIHLEHRGEVWVVSGDYKTQSDPTCAPFQPLRCHTFVTESTFGLPIYQWREQSDVLTEIDDWWRENSDAGRVSLLFAYSLGKAQRVIAGVDTEFGPIFCHGAIQRLNDAYRRSGVDLAETSYAGEFDGRNQEHRRALVLAPPSARATPWLRRFGDYASGFASGWMQIRGARRRRAVERGFVLSDHADWPGLMGAIQETGADRVLVTHGAVGPMVRWLREKGLRADSLHTEFQGEQDEVQGETETVGEEPAT